jgi:hypothetical protein
LRPNSKWQRAECGNAKGYSFCRRHVSSEALFASMVARKPMVDGEGSRVNRCGEWSAVARTANIRLDEAKLEVSSADNARSARNRAIR